MRLRFVPICGVLLSLGACGASALTDMGVLSGDPTGTLGDGQAGPPSIAGQYVLTSVNGETLPYRALMDSTGATVTFIAGSLVLGDAPPETFATTPAGYVPSSCVHEIPDGAHVDTAGVVTLPDSSQYQLPECGDGAYELLITRRYDYANGTSNAEPDSASGRYAWSGEPPELIALLGRAGMAGPLTITPKGVTLKLHRDHFGQSPVSTPSDPTYQFIRVRTPAPSVGRGRR